MVESEWLVVVLRSKSTEAKSVLIDLYRYIEHLPGVTAVHFLIRDRVDDDVVFSFRVLPDQTEKEHVRDAIAVKLKNTFPADSFAIDPKLGNPLQPYAAWPWLERTARGGPEKISSLGNYLGQLSRLAVEMAEGDYFASEERVEMAHLAAWTLGCTEYGWLSAQEIQVGHYDRIEDRYHIHLRETFRKSTGDSVPTPTQ